MATHVYVPLNDRFGKLACRTCGGDEGNPVHRSLVEQIQADAGLRPTARPSGAPLVERMTPDVRARMEAVISRQTGVSRPTGPPAVDALLAGPREPHSRAEALAADIVNGMAKLAPAFGVKRKTWAETSKWDRALWIATVREALT